MKQQCKHLNCYDPDGDTVCLDCNQVVDAVGTGGTLWLSPRDKWMLGRNDWKTVGQKVSP